MGIGRSCVASIVAVVVILTGLPAEAGARTDDRAKRVVFVHGYSGAEQSKCGKTWRDMVRHFRAWGWSKTFFPVRYYVRDTKCGTADSVSTHGRIDHHGSHAVHFGGDGHEGTSHDSDASIRHLAYHFSHYVWDHFSSKGRYVDVAAHSMGGLVVRYALAKTGEGEPGFPPRLLIEDVVTMGTPHRGTRNSSLCAFDTQCQEMYPTSTLMGYLGHYATNPQGHGGTDWTVIGAHDDDLVTAGSATGMNVFNAIRYLSGQAIEHSDYMHRTRDISDAVADMWNRWEARWRRNDAWVWPVRSADYALYGGLD